MSYQENRGETGEDIARRLASLETVQIIIEGTAEQAVSLLNETARTIGEKISVRRFPGRDGKEQKEALVTTSQIRGIFSVVREIEQLTLTAEDLAPLEPTAYRRLSMLRPKLAYQDGRIDKKPTEARKAATHALVLILTQAIDEVERLRTIRSFRNFVDFFEAILAYHKYYGGSEKAAN